jgi:hypothetical protein
MSTRRKTVITVGLLLLVVAIQIQATNRMIFNNPVVRSLDEAGEEYLTDSLRRAFYVFAVVRGINGVVSVIQGSELELMPGGVGVEIAVGEVLDPVNDIIERFSWVLMMAVTSLGIQLVLTEMAAWFGVKVLLTLALMVLALGLWRPRLLGTAVTRAGLRLLLAALFIRFLLPVISLANHHVYELFLDHRFEAAMGPLEQDYLAEKAPLVRLDQEGRGKVVTPDEESFWGDITDWFDSVRSTLDLRRRVDDLKQKMANYVEYIMDLTVIFFFHTIAVPLLVLWAMWRMVGWMGRGLTFLAAREESSAASGSRDPEAASNRASG